MHHNAVSVHPYSVIYYREQRTSLLWHRGGGEIVGGRSYLYGTPTHRHKGLDGSRVVTSGKLFLLRFPSGDDGDGEELLVDTPVELEDDKNLMMEEDRIN